MRKVIISKKEYQYLRSCLLKNDEKIINEIKRNSKSNAQDTIELNLDDETVYDIWQLADENIALHFDENYEPTKKGLILEDLLDKFYF